MTSRRTISAQFVAAILLMVAWPMVRDNGPDVTSGPLLASKEFIQVGSEFVTTAASDDEGSITQSLSLEPNRNYVLTFEAASASEARIVAGFAAGRSFVPGASFSLDLDRRGGPVKVRHFLNSGASPEGLQLRIATSSDKILVRRVSLRKRSLPWTVVAWCMLLLSLLLFLTVGRRLTFALPGTISWAWPVVAVISFACILRNLALPRPFVFGDELIYAMLARFAGREALLAGNVLIPRMPNSLYLQLYQWMFRFDENFLEVAKILNVVFLAVALLAIYATVRLFQSRSTALLAVAIIGLAPANIYSTCFMPECMYFCFFSLLVFFLVRYVYAQPFLAATLCGLCLAGAILVKPHGLILIAPWLIALLLLKLSLGRNLSWQRTGGMALYFVLTVGLGVGLLNFVLTGETRFGLGTIYGPMAAHSASSGSLGRIAGLMGSHLAAISSLYALPLWVAVCYLFQRPLRNEAGSTEKEFRLNALVWLTLVCLITLIFTTSKFTTLWGPGESESQRLFVRYYYFMLPWLVASFFCAYPELQWSKPHHRAWFIAGGIALGSVALLAILKLGPSHFMTFVDFPDVFFFYTQPTRWRFFVAALTTATLIPYLLRKPSAALYGASLGLLVIIGSIWMSEYVMAQPPMPGDVAPAVFRPLIRPRAFDRGLVLVANGSDLDAYRLIFHMHGAYEVAAHDPSTPVDGSTIADRPWIILSAPSPVNFSYRESISMGRYTLYLRQDAIASGYSHTEGAVPVEKVPVEQTLADPQPPFVRIDILGKALPSDAPVVAADAPLQISGWAIDPKQGRLAGGVVVVVDQKTYPAAYGLERRDVADFFRNPLLISCGYSVDIPHGVLARGTHDVSVRVIARDRSVYWVGSRMKFTAR